MRNFHRTFLDPLTIHEPGSPIVNQHFNRIPEHTKPAINLPGDGPWQLGFTGNWQLATDLPQNSDFAV
jgi:hypothetical protein